MGEKADKVADLLEGTVKAFNDAGVRYCLCGGWAVGFWGFVRMTTDIDAFIAKEDLEEACEAIEPVGFLFKAGIIPLPSQGIEFFRVSAFAGEDIVPLDLYPVEGADARLQRKATVEWRGLEVPVLDINDLIAMKSTSERGKDKIDVIELQRIRDEPH